jgi:predicted outer membrane repeat protein
MFKKRYLFLIIIICLFAISAVSATEISNETIGYDSTLIAESVDNNLLTGDFDELQQLINNNEIVNLTKNYGAVGDNGRVHINSNKIIYGNGHTLNGNEQTGIFEIEGGNIVFNDINFINGKDSDGDGGAIHVSSADSLTFNNVKFSNNYADYNGGAISINTDKLLNMTQFINCNFENNIADADYGGAIYYSSNQPLIISNSTFKSNKCNGNTAWTKCYGGAIHAETSILNVTDSSFIENVADDYGGAICSGNLLHNTNNTFIKNCTFKSNEAADYDGGAIYLFNSKSCSIEDSIFIENSAELDGGAIYAEGCKLFVTNSSFKSNYCEYNIASYCYGGGAIRAISAIIKKCLFESNYVSGSGDVGGGAITLGQFSGDNEISDSTFIGNHARTGDGGAINILKYETTLGQSNIRNCTFKSNNADSGGAINGLWTNIIGCTFENNHADDDGGAIKTINANIYSSYFKDNAADDNGGAIYGTELYDLSCFVNIVDSIFDGNNALIDAGAIYCEDDVIANNTTFKNNKAEGALVSDSYGGAIRSKHDVKCYNCSFLNNHAADYGGAIYALSVYINSASSFINNRADQGSDASYNDGGAIYAENYVSISDSILTGNSAIVDGGAVYAKGNVNLKNATFDNNEASGSNSAQCYGGAIRSEGDVTIDNCSFLNNYAADYGGAIYGKSVSISASYFNGNRVDDNDGGAVYAEGEVKIDNSTFLNNHAYDNGGAVYADSITWVNNLYSYFIGNYVEDNCGGAIYTNKLNTDIFYGIFINNQAKANDDGGAIYINKEYHGTIAQCYFENNRCGDEGGAIYTDSMNSQLKFLNNIFIDNDAGDKGDIVYNSGYYEAIAFNWFGINDPNFDNKFKEYHVWGSDTDHLDDFPVHVKLLLDNDCEVGKEYNLTVYFEDGKGNHAILLCDLINITITADNNAKISDWHKVSECTYVTGITFTNINTTTITANVNKQVLTISFSPVKGNVTMDINTSETVFGENAIVEINFTPNTATGIVNVGNVGTAIKDGVAKLTIRNLTVGDTTLPVYYSGDWSYNPAQGNVTITVKRKNLNINATAEPIHLGENATVIVNGLENATGNITVTINDNTWSGKISGGKATIIITGLTANVTANVTYPGDNNYNNASTTVDIIVHPGPKKNLTITADAKPISVGETAYVIVSGLENATGNVTVTVNSETWSGKISNSKAIVLVKGLTGNVTADVFYGGDYRYNNASTTVDITVNPATMIWYVNGSRNSSGDGKSVETAFKTLREAINKAPDGSTIYIMPGNYTGTDNVALIIIRNLNFVKYGDGEAIFDARSQSRIWTVQADSINITDLTFKNGNERYGAAILFMQSIKNSNINGTFINNSVKSQGGVFYFKGNLSNVNINGYYANNSAKTQGGVFNFYGNLTDVTISGDYTNNTARQGAVINVDTLISNSSISGNYKNNYAENAIDYIIGAENISLSGTYIGNIVSKGNVVYFEYSGNNAIIHDSIFINNALGNIYSSGDSILAVNNWFGNNATNYNKTPKVKGNITMDTWLFLNATANPGELKINQTSAITFNLYSYNHTSNTTEDYDASKMNIQVELSQTLGELNKQAALIGEEIIYTAKEGGNASVTGKFETASYTVNLKNNNTPLTPTNISVNTTSLNLTVGETGTIGATLNPPEAGGLVFTSNDTNIATVDENGVVTAVAGGNAIITVSFPGNDQYAAAENKTVTVTVSDKPTPKKDLNITASAEPITVGENATVIVSGFVGEHGSHATGTVTVTAAGKTFNGTIKSFMLGGYIAEIIVTGLNETTIANVNYPGDENYNPANTTVEIIVNPAPDRKNLTLNASAEPITVGENATIIVTGFENATGDVSARIEGGLLSAPIVNGTATFTVLGLTSNTTAYIIYEGDKNYNPANTTVKITVYPKSDVVIVAENVTKYYGGPERFVANIYDPQGNPLVNKSVNITINGVKYTRTTDDNGTVTMAIRLGSGTYEVTTQVDNTTVKSTITVLSTVSGSDLTKYYRNATQYSVQLYDTNGKAVGKGEVVTFNINGIIYKRTTDEKGIATLNINLPPSNYIITADYKGCRIANNITVLPVLNASDIKMKYMDGTQFKVNLVDGHGNPYKNQFVRFNVNGIFYDRLTDSNGQAALNIRLPPGEYIITSSFNGANIANKITITG